MKIVVFGGTIEGRLLVEKLLENASIQESADEVPVNQMEEDLIEQIHVFVATEYGGTLLPEEKKVEVHVGRLNMQEMRNALKDISPNLCVDATHPYAIEVSENIKKACELEDISYLRFLRRETSLDYDLKEKNSACVKQLGCENVDDKYVDDEYVDDKYVEGIKIVEVENIEAAVAFLDETEGKIFITTGSKELHKYTAIKNYESRCVARVLPTLEVMEICHKLAFQGKNLIAMQGPFTEEMNVAMLKQTGAKWLVTKSSGAAGGFEEKYQACILANVNMLIIGRPKEELEEAFVATSINEVLSKIRER